MNYSYPSRMTKRRGILRTSIGGGQHKPGGVNLYKRYKDTSAEAKVKVERSNPFDTSTLWNQSKK